jgi:CHAT domain-containing protein
MKHINRNIAFLVLALISIGHVYSQDKEPVSVKYIQTLVAQDSLEKARAELKNNLTIYRAEKRYDSLADLIQFVGSFTLNNGDKKLSVKKAEALTEEIRKTNDPHAIKIAFVEMSWIYEDMGENQKSYNIVSEAIPYVKRITTPKNTDHASIHYSLGYSITRIGNYPQAKKHYLESLRLLKKSEDEDYVFYNQIYTSLGGLMWQEAKLDSAQYYFSESLKMLQKTDQDDIMNKYYRPALVKSNLVIIYNALGKNTEAIKTSYEVIDAYQEYIKRSTDEGRIKRVKGHIASTLDNLASFYNTLGEYERTEAIMQYAYKQKKKIYEPNDINIIISLIVIAEAKVNSRDFEGASKYINEALELLKSSSGAELYWDAAATSTRASIYELTGDIENAKKYYEISDKIYEKSLNGAVNRDVLSHIIDRSSFFAKNNEPEKAITLAKDTYLSVREGDLKYSLQDYYQTVNLARVYYVLKMYNEAVFYSQEAIDFNIINDAEKETAADSILTQYRKPQAIFINTASKYYQATRKDEVFLKELLSKIEEGISILEQRRKVVTTHEDVTTLITENEELFNFAKKLRLKLYELTKDEAYLEQLISLHESGIYNKIRSRLNLRDNVAFKNVPNEILETETKLKSNLVNALDETEAKIENYINASEAWEVFVKMLQKEYPKYYKMRYASIEESLDGLQKMIPENTTIVRYLFIDEELHVFIVTNSFKKIVKLDDASVKDHIEKLNKVSYDVAEIAPVLFNLYNVLWKPFQKDITSKKVIIIPDRELFNLSFEMITPKPLKSFKEFTTNSLLAKHDISYNYSLLLFKDKGKVIDYKEDFVAFAPGFTSKMKEDYKVGIKDSVSLDKTYLTLLPQPNSEDLVKRYSKVFKGSFYINENASKEVFKNKAPEHKIIHIGTHAENNNISPELSRLIFAKNSNGTDSYNENSLYTYEIYNINLSSNLAILTACETGKPTHQPGEGMISLAHAFNYAGSESILTSLWQIDEESSTEIIKYFYDNISEGLEKDEALRKAKLKYLSSAEGRTAAPQYWAGLVLIGDTTPIDVNSGLSLWWWIFGSLIILGFTFLFLIRRKNKAK